MTTNTEYYDEYLPFKNVVAGWVLGLLTAIGIYWVMKGMGLV